MKKGIFLLAVIVMAGNVNAQKNKSALMEEDSMYFSKVKYRSPQNPKTP